MLIEVSHQTHTICFFNPIGMSLALKNGKKVKIYFANAYHSWKRGTNENYNKMIGRYYPKGTDFTTITNKDLQSIINRINNYPRKQFSFETSAFYLLKNYQN